MNRRLWDTDTFSLFRRDNPGIVARVEAETDITVLLSVFTIEEALSGWYDILRKAKSETQRVEAYRRLEETVTATKGFSLLPVTEGAWMRFRALQAQRIKVRPADLRIAAIALENDVILVTRNTQDFERVPGLTIENWAS